MAALTVTELVERMRGVISAAVGTQWVEGEISNLRPNKSGHCYFSLKDAAAEIPCALFKGVASTLALRLQDGQKVRVLGDATVYVPTGRLQLIIKKIEALGRGDLYAKFLALKAKLAAEGVFEAERKKRLPPFPMTIGLITSPTGAALQDMIQVLQRRAPWVRVYLYPVRVQGAGAAQEIAQAVQAWSSSAKNNWQNARLPAVDLLIVGRGGGSIEDLWCFNDEVLARAIVSCQIPVVSAVGHETDTTIADFVADLRAPTPTAAAELATPNKVELMARLSEIDSRLRGRIKMTLKQAHYQIERYESDKLMDKGGLLAPYIQRLDESSMRLHYHLDKFMAEKQRRLFAATQKLDNRHSRHFVKQQQMTLDALASKLSSSRYSIMVRAKSKIDLLTTRVASSGPQAVLSKGYAIVQDSDGKLINRVSQTSPADVLTITVQDGSFDAFPLAKN